MRDGVVAWIRPLLLSLSAFRPHNPKYFFTLEPQLVRFLLRLAPRERGQHSHHSPDDDSEYGGATYSLRTAL